MRRLRQENDHLRRQCAELSAAAAARQHQPQPRATNAESPRELKKLRYQVDKLTARLTDREAELRRFQALVGSYEARPGHEPGEPAEEPLHQAADTSMPTTLRGKKIALIGGLDRATPYYEQTIEQLGSCYLFHNGDLGHGHKRLAEVIKQADMVLCPVDRSSHGAATSAKKLCRALHKPCYFLRSSGVSHLREKLLELSKRA